MNEPTNPQMTPRYHGLDAYRSFAMLGGVIIHAAMAHTYPEIRIWPVKNQDGSLLFTLLLFTLHAFRLQAFFLMAGFFAGLLVEKRGLLPFIRNRMMRIALPLGIASLTLIPLVQALFVWGYERRGYPGLQRIGLLFVEMPEYYGSVSDFFLSGRSIAGFHWFHLWFLWYLLAIYLIWLPLEFIFRNWLIRPNADEPVDSSKEIPSTKRWKTFVALALTPIWLALPSATLIYPMKIWQADSPMAFWPEWPILSYYLFFFFIGRLLYRQRHLLGCFHRATWWYLGIGLLVAMPIMLTLQMYGPHESTTYQPGWKCPALITYSIFTWLMILGWLGFFLRYFEHPVRWIRYLSESAYWQYLAHIPPLLLIQILIADLPIPIYFKFLAVSTSIYLFLFLSYQYLVRSSWIGWLLNGKRFPR